MVKKILAEAIKNPVLPKSEGTYTGVESSPSGPLGALIGRLWWTVVIVGGLTLLIFLIWGGIDFLTSEGDQEKYKNAKNKMTHALMGMAILAASFVIVQFISTVFKIEILKPKWPTP